MPRARPARTRGSRSPRDHRPDHVLRRDGGQLGRHRRHLDQRAFQQLLQPLPAAGPVLDQVGAGPGVVAQLPDRGRRHERGTQHPHLGQPGQPHRVQPVGLGQAGQVPGLASGDQLHRQPGAFQHVVPDPPVVRGGLQRHHLNPVRHQPGGQRQHRVHGGPHLPDRAVPGTGPGRVRRAGAHHPRGLGHIDRGYPVKDPLVLLILDYLRLAHHGLLCSWRWVSSGLPGGLGQESRNTDRRAQGNKKRPSGQGPSARLLYGFTPHGRPASRAARSPPSHPARPPRSHTPRPRAAAASARRGRHPGQFPPARPSTR